ncbi:MAG TPA: AAA family ATPase [Geobacteraceae bacterium]
MYCSFYGFTEKPFVVTPDPRYVFLSKNHREAFAHLLYGIDNYAGFIELTGEVGTGKTTMLRTLLSQLAEEHYRLALIFNPSLSTAELLALICREFGLTCDNCSSAELLGTLYRFLLQENIAGRMVVLVIDEAQNLSPEVMEQVRLISNLETERNKLIQIVLAGQPELGALLERPELRQLNQRITVRYHLRPMDFDDTCAYIAHRLDVSGGRGAVAFANGALKHLYRATHGIPRLVNIIADRALLVGYAEGSRQITSRMMAQAISEIGGERRLFRGRNRLFSAVGIAVCVLVVVSLIFLAGKGQRAGETPASGAVGSDAALVRKLATISEVESGRQALNAVLAPWGARAVSALAASPNLRTLRAAVGNQAISVSHIAGSLGLLRRLDLPVVLEVTLPKGGGRLLALTGVDGERLLVTSPAGGSVALTPAELERIWTGRAYVVWRNPLQLALPLTPGARGSDVERLQRYLNRAGVYTGQATGRYDRTTEEAIRHFQEANGLPEDGRVGEQTLTFLVRTGEGSTFPSLVKPVRGTRL